ncbi:MAG: hypothetical protein JW750_02075 [Anaerolineaceae bacterium]|nr:hypothetical protein [Anaerolineaceae bacterium]
MLTSACSGAATSEPESQISTQSLPEEAGENPDDSVDDGEIRVVLETGNLASGFVVETVAAVEADGSGPYWDVLPEYTRVTLDGYQVGDHLMQPQLFIFPLAELAAANESAEQIAASLKTLIESPQEIETMPFLPLFNAKQIMHSQIQYLDFQGGAGLRYLTMFSQGIVPVNNHDLIYTYQGITADGQYYVAAVLPVHHASLPADASITGEEGPEFESDYLAYVKNAAQDLNIQSADTFTPNLTDLDAMLSSLEVR